MPPAAVEVRSPIDSPQPKQSNPNSMAQSRPSSSINLGKLYSGFGDATECGSDRGGADFARPAATGRPRPRLVKVRKQAGAQNPRSRGGGPSEVSSGLGLGLGFDTFCSSSGVSFEKGGCGNGDFVFGANQGGLGESLGGKADETGKLNVETGMESAKIENVGFVFGDKETSAKSNSSGEKEQSFANAKESVTEEKGDTKTECERESGKLSGGFVFGCNWRGLGSNSDQEKNEYGEFAKKTNAAFVFGANQNGNVDFSKSFDQFGFGSGTNVKAGQETELGKSSGSKFVFGASWFNSKSKTSASLEKRGFSEKAEASDEVDCNQRWKLDGDTGVFVFGSKSRTDSSSNERTKENLGNFNSSVDTQVQNKGPDVSVEVKYPHKSGDYIAGNASVSGTSSEHKLPDEMRKLNIDDSVNVSDVEKTEVLKAKPFSNAGAASTFRRYRKVRRGCRKVSNSSCRNIESYSCDGSSKGPSVDVESQKTDGHISGSSEQSHVVFGSGCNATDVSGTYKSEPFIFLAGLGESAEFGQLRKCQVNYDTEPKVAFSQSTFSSNCHESQPRPSEAAFVGIEKKDASSSPSTPEGLRVPSTDLKTPLCDPFSLKESLFPERSKKAEFTVKNRSIKDKRLKETKRKPRKPLVKQLHDQDHASKESSAHENPNTPGCYSPMDFSPYQETTVDDQFSRETSASDAPVPADLKEEDLATTGKGFDNDRHEQGSKVPSAEILGDHNERSFNEKCPPVSMPEFACSSSQTAQADGHSGVGVASVESRGVFSSDMENQEKISRMQFQYGTENVSATRFNSGMEDIKGANFMFSAASGQGQSSARRHRYRRKSRIGVVKVESSSVQSSTVSDTSSLPGAADKSEAGKQFVQGHSSSSAQIHETCEKWRLRGNQAYKNRDLSQAEAFYTQGIVSVPSSERSGSCLEPLLLCYSNRAATRMCLLRIREAIGDCTMAVALDPNFLKVQMRAANCHLLLGEVENAQQYFTNCLEAGAGVCLDRRIIIDAADGQSKAQLRRHEEVIQLCEQSLSFAEKNFTSVETVADVDGTSNEGYSFARLWRWCLISKSYFHLGRLEAALSLLDKLAKVRSINDESASKDLESSASLAITIRDLLHQKNAGNEAFKSGRYAEAADYYTVALSRNVDSRQFAAVCFCNRAAAHQALGQIADAISDCSLAIALDGNYAKAVSRRATLHEMIRDYAEAASDLQRLISIFESQSCDKAKESSYSARSTRSVKDLRQAQMLLPVMEEKAKTGDSLEFYLILGCKPSDTSADIKKAYRKAALKHHPDKAGQFLARTDSGDEGRLWKEISQEIHKDADRLFKMIGEAYAVLSDPDKRSQYDLDEELRKAPKGSSTHRKHSNAHSSGNSPFRRSDFQSSPFERSSYKRNSREHWRTHGNSYY
ncbi:hypothetical protein TIFTF001_024544 [Ficus carica]|uniref:J domain-containing protein n=1 Tax=Ficus carica TaxID=3494 RepID=A0AA88DG45_FICCA|nr:hypothetical protein TIFTF001_024544 [Ficus carica]